MENAKVVDITSQLPCHCKDDDGELLGLSVLLGEEMVDGNRQHCPDCGGYIDLVEV